MDGNYQAYGWVSSAERIDDILGQPSGQFVEQDSLPDRDKLTFTNGFYSYCSALYVDIRESSKLTSAYTRPILAKIYRSFISEMVAVLNGTPTVREVSIVGDCVWAVYNTPQKTDIDEVFRVAFTANTLMRLLNIKFARSGYETLIAAGIGMDYGRALMIKAGYNGSGINDVVYMGDVVNRAAHLAYKAGRGYSQPIWVGETLAQNLNDHNQSLLAEAYSYEMGHYRHGSVVLSTMDEWIEDTFS